MKKGIFLLWIPLVLTSLAGAQDSELASLGLTPQERAELKNVARQTAREMKTLMSDFKTFYDEIKSAVEEEGIADFGDDEMAFGQADIMEDDQMMIVKVDMPGIRKDRIKIRLKNLTELEIEAEREVSRKVSGVQNGTYFYQTERQQGVFRRTLQLPQRAADKGFEASLENGVLTVRIPKENSKPPTDVRLIPVT